MDNADVILESHGFSRTGPWTRSGGQWAAEVERREQEAKTS